MKKFRLTADVLFEAEDIIDARNKLSLHFQKVATVIDSDLISEGSIILNPIDGNDKEWWAAKKVLTSKSTHLDGKPNRFIKGER